MKLRKIMAAAVSSVVAATVLTLGASAYIDGGIIEVNDREFTLPEGGNMMLGDNRDSGNSAWDAFVQPGQQDPDNEAAGIALSQNGALWSKIDTITVSFYIEDLSGAALPEDVGYIQSYIQLGNDAGWDFYSDGINCLEQLSETGFGYGPDYVMTATLDIKSRMEAKGSDSAQGGVLKCGLQIGNNGIDTLNLKVVFTDLQVAGDADTIAEYTAIGDSLYGEVVTPADDTTPADTTTPAPTTEKGSPDTGVEGVAAIAGIAVVAAGAVVLSKKRK